MRLRSDPRAVAALLFGATAIGFAPILARLAETGPAAAAFWRLLFALPLLAPLAFRRREERAPPSRWAVLAGVFFALDLAFWHYGLTLTSVANATTLTNLTPVVVTIAAWLLFGERPRRLFVAALLLAVGGAVVVALAKGSGGRGLNPPLGDLLSAITALWYGAYFVCVRQARVGGSASSVMFWSGAVGAPLLLLVAFALGEDVIPASAAGWAACVGLGLMHASGQGAIAWALGRLPTALAAVTVLVQPVVAAALGWLIFSERVTPVQGLGAAVLLAGVVLAQASAARARAAKEKGAAPVGAAPLSGGA
jgi:drug/metabolite transporter (DMT)-like permease